MKMALWRPAALLLLGALGPASGAPVPEGAAPIDPGKKGVKPIRVLVWSGAAGREHQLLRRFLLAEADGGRVELSVCLQPPPGLPERPRKAVPEPARNARALTRFPDEMGGAPAPGPSKRPFDLAGYDVVVAIDPDWERLSEAQAKALRKWVATGGGLVVVAGAINASRLAGAKAPEKLGRVRELLPVELADGAEKRDTTRPWRLAFPKGKHPPAYLKLDPAGKGPFAGWEEFFRDGRKGGKPGEVPERGFYSCHPVKAVRPGATVLARFGDPKARLGDGTERPWLAARVVGSGRVTYLGSGEVWRLRAYDGALYDRFWRGLLNEMAGRRAAAK